MSKPLTLSIIIPAYNEEDHIKLCLNSIAAQSTPADGVIVVDNNSVDATAAIAGGYPFVRLIKEKQQGIVFARDTGFNAATTQLIGRIDADTVLPPDWVAKVKAFYAKPRNQKKVLTGGAVFRNMPMPRLAGWFQKQLAFRLNWLALGHHIVWGSNMVIPRTVWETVRDKICRVPFIHEDIDLAMHVHEQKVPITYQPKLLVSAVMRRVLTDRDKLWPNLKWWPRTLRWHRKKRWPIAAYGAGSVYLMSLLVRWRNDRQKSGRKPPEIT
jgi:glycosyltransferase involved in cell wall biosynthesis